MPALGVISGPYVLLQLGAGRHISSGGGFDGLVRREGRGAKEATEEEEVRDHEIRVERVGEGSVIYRRFRVYGGGIEEDGPPGENVEGDRVRGRGSEGGDDVVEKGEGPGDAGNDFPGEEGLLSPVAGYHVRMGVRGEMRNGGLRTVGAVKGLGKGLGDGGQVEEGYEALG